MRRFYELVRVDAKTKQFFAACSVCGQTVVLGKLPVSCRNAKHLSDFRQGKGGLRQFFYNKCTANAVQKLSLQFNRCARCGTWVCDNCFTCNSEDGLCINCKNKEEQTWDF